MIDSPSSPLAAFDIVIDPRFDDVPRMMVSRRFAELMPPAFVAELNVWMLERFGTHHVMYEMRGNRIAMGPKGYAELKEATR